MTVYIDAAYRCHAEAGEGLTAVEHAFFDGKCAAFIEAYRLVPQGCTWTRADGAVFCGEMIAPHREIALALAAQAVWEEMIAGAPAYAAAYDEGVQSV